MAITMFYLNMSPKAKNEEVGEENFLFLFKNTY